MPLDALGLGLRAVYRAISARLPIGREGSEVFDLRDIATLVRDEEIVELIDDAAPPLPEFPPLAPPGELLASDDLNAADPR